MPGSRAQGCAHSDYSVPNKSWCESAYVPLFVVDCRYRSESTLHLKAVRPYYFIASAIISANTRLPSPDGCMPSL